MNFSRLSVLKTQSCCFLFALLVIICGCGPKDGAREIRDGRDAYANGDYRKAEKCYLRAEKLNPANADAPLGLAQLKLRLGELAEAKKCIARAEKLAAGDSDVRLLGAQIAWHAKDYRRAVKLFDGIANDVALTPEIRSQGFAGRGIVEMACNEHDLARIAFLRAIRLDRRNASAWYHLGLLYRFEPFGYNEAALDQFEIFIRLEKNASPRVQKTQRVIIPALKDLIARATMDIPGASKRNSAASASALSRAEKAWKKGQYNTAMIAYREALAADPLAYPAALGLARSIVKAVDRKTEHPESLSLALGHYRRACALRPSAVSTFLEAGRFAERLKQVATAREIYSRAVAANPASLDAIDGLIRSIRKTGTDAKVAQAYQAYREMLPKGKK